MKHHVEHRADDHQFVVTELGHEAVLEYYELPDNVIDLAHTYTPNEIRGRGIATSLIRHALEYAREHDKRVIPGCPFVSTYIDRHREYADLLVDNRKHD